MALRRGRRSDRDGVLDVDHRAFDPFWRLDAAGCATRSTPPRRAGTGWPSAPRWSATPSGAGPNERGYLQRLAVDPAQHREGIGTALVADGLTLAASPSCAEGRGQHAGRQHGGGRGVPRPRLPFRARGADGAGHRPARPPMRRFRGRAVAVVAGLVLLTIGAGQAPTASARAGAGGGRRADPADHHPVHLRARQRGVPGEGPGAERPGRVLHLHDPAPTCARPRRVHRERLRGRRVRPARPDRHVRHRARRRPRHRRRRHHHGRRHEQRPVTAVDHPDPGPRRSEPAHAQPPPVGRTDEQTLDETGVYPVQYRLLASNGSELARVVTHIVRLPTQAERTPRASGSRRDRPPARRDAGAAAEREPRGRRRRPRPHRPPSPTHSPARPRPDHAQHRPAGPRHAHHRGRPGRHRRAGPARGRSPRRTTTRSSPRPMPGSTRGRSPMPASTTSCWSSGSRRSSR